jgi:heme a synthase
MALIGAITRLTESGLSIVYWKPFTDLIPPLSAARWQELFEMYRASPQYLQVNRGMSLEEFQTIFWWEWIHRQWGRLIGLVYALPLLWFALTRRVRGALLLKLLGLLLLGSLQAVAGWFMVASGLIDRPSVSHYRLAIHLTLALLIFCLLIRLALSLQNQRPLQAPPPALLAQTRWGFALLLLTIIWGAFVAGLDAGLIYNEYPLMGGRFFPTEGLDLAPLWLNFFENHAAVQFTHRWLAMLTALALLVIGWEVRQSPNASSVAKRVALWVMLAVGLQISLGISTLLTQVNIVLATAHQGGAFLLAGLVSALLWALRRGELAR